MEAARWSIISTIYIELVFRCRAAQPPISDSRTSSNEKWSAPLWEDPEIHIARM